MTFLSLPFFVFFPAVVLGYHLLPRSCKAGWLLLASWFFYLCAGAEYAPFLLAVILLSYGAGRLMERGPRRWAVVGTVALCAGMLFVFKYLNFACSLAAGVLSAAGLSVSAPVFDLILPAGISFYLFEAMGYVIDVYRGKLPAQRNLLRHALFLSFFPQLLSGPIARAPQLLPQLEALPRLPGILCGAVSSVSCGGLSRSWCWPTGWPFWCRPSLPRRGSLAGYRF